MDFPDDQGNTGYINTIFNCNPVSAPAAQDWMAAISDGTILLSRLTIPGTHDSCTFNASAISKCQNLPLDAQLNAGIRCIDIRCRQFNDTFELHHGREYLGLNFNYVLTTCSDFLQAHPGECIVMSIKEEHTLSGVGGKMVLLRRFYLEPKSDATIRGIDLSAWPENTTFTSPDPSAP